jgi:hypothetical protein
MEKPIIFYPKEVWTMMKMIFKELPIWKKEQE